MALKHTGHTIDADHYGAGFSFRSGSWSDSAVIAVVDRIAGYSNSRDPRSALAVGGRNAIIERLTAFVERGISKLVLRPIGSDDTELIDQTRRLIEEVLPAVPALNAKA